MYALLKSIKGLLSVEAVLALGMHLIFVRRAVVVLPLQLRVALSAWPGFIVCFAIECIAAVGATPGQLVNKRTMI